MTEYVLQVENVHLAFGGVKALSGVSMVVTAGELTALLGPNGSGKTSLLNCINGFYRPQTGSIRVFDQDIGHVPAPNIVQLGVARTFQNVEILSKCSVIDNVLLGRHIHMRQSLVGGALLVGAAAKEEQRNRERVMEILAFLGLENAANRLVGSMPYGTQKLVEIGRALAMEPKLLLLDEPTSGMTPGEKEIVADLILRIRSEMGMTQLLIEHDMSFVARLCARAVVLNTGKLIADAAPQVALADPKVVSSYLGVEFAS